MGGWSAALERSNPAGFGYGNVQPLTTQTQKCMDIKKGAYKSRSKQGFLLIIVI